MPITRKQREEESEEEHTFTSVAYKPRWFVLSQTHGRELEPTTIPEWDSEKAIAALSIERVAFDKTDGNCQGFARKRQIAISPVGQLPYKTLFHELAHVVLRHTTEADAVVLLCCESLGLEVTDYCRGYIQNWLYQGSD